MSSCCGVVAARSLRLRVTRLPAPCGAKLITPWMLASELVALPTLTTLEPPASMSRVPVVRLTSIKSLPPLRGIQVLWPVPNCMVSWTMMWSECAPNRTVRSDMLW